MYTNSLNYLAKNETNKDNRPMMRPQRFALCAVGSGGCGGAVGAGGGGVGSGRGSGILSPRMILSS